MNVNNSLMFDKYIVRSSEELAQLKKEVSLEGAFAITGDTKPFI